MLKISQSLVIRDQDAPVHRRIHPPEFLNLGLTYLQGPVMKRYNDMMCYKYMIYMSYMCILFD